MSQEDVDAARLVYESWNREDYGAFFAALDPEIEWVLPEGGPNTGTLRGRQAVREFVESYVESFENWRVEPEEFIAAGDRIIVSARQTGRGRGSGVQIENRQVHVLTVRGDSVTRVQIFADRAEAFEAAGLR